MITQDSPLPALPFRHVFITGGAGFIGSHLVQTLLGAGVAVTVLDDLSTGRAENLSPFFKLGQLRLLRGDVCDVDAVARGMQPLDGVGKPDLIIHLAAAVGVRLIIERPVESIATNIRGTEVVMELAAQTNTKTMIASSSEVYGKGTRVPFAEDDDLLLGPTVRPRWSYACSKMIDEFLALAYHQAQGMPVVVTRFFNTVGPGQTGRYGMVIPRLVRQALAGEPLSVYGDGSQSRAFCHVRDTGRIVLELACRPEAEGQIFNVGNNAEITIQALAEKIVAATGSSSEIQHIPFEEAYDHNFEDLKRRVPNLEKLHDTLGGYSYSGIDQIIDEVVAFERDQTG